MRLRLRETSTVDYQVRRENAVWPDHRLRTLLTANLIAWFEPASILDPACGDASIVATANAVSPMRTAFLADVSRLNVLHIESEMRPRLPPELRVAQQPLEQSLAEPGSYDVVVLTEILEHVEDPVSILRLARSRASILIASSPLFLDDSVRDPNPEHLWQFDADGYREMLDEAGWSSPVVFIPLTFWKMMYDYQIWAVR